jgi:hypothetical protein
MMRTPLAPALCLLGLVLLVPLAAAAEGQLPAPTGAFGIGLSIFDWTDDSRLETQSEKGGAHRELLVYRSIRRPPAPAATTFPIARKRSRDRSWPFNAAAGEYLSSFGPWKWP